MDSVEIMDLSVEELSVEELSVEELSVEEYGRLVRRVVGVCCHT